MRNEPVENRKNIAVISWVSPISIVVLAAHWQTSFCIAEFPQSMPRLALGTILYSSVSQARAP